MRVSKSSSSLLLLNLLLAPVIANAQAIGEQDLSAPPQLIIPPDRPGIVTQGGEMPIGVTEQQLAPISSDTVGLLDKMQGGLDANIWQGTRRRTAEMLLEKLPVNNTSRTLGQLRYLLLASTTTPPEGKGAYDNLLGLRIKQLSAMGEADAADRLLSLLPANAITDDIQQNIVTEMLLRKRFIEACQKVSKALEKGDSPEWRRYLITCQAIQGEADKAELGMNLLAEEGKPLPEGFTTAITDLGKRQGDKTKTVDDAILQKLVTTLNQENGSTMLAPVKAELSQDVMNQLANAPHPAFTVDSVASWWKQQASKTNDEKVAALARLYSMMEALNIPVPSQEWGKLLLGSSNLSDVVIQRNLFLAANEKREGETIALVLISLGDKPPASADAENINRAIKALHLIGMDEQAMALAREVMSVTKADKMLVAPNPSFYKPQ